MKKKTAILFAALAASAFALAPLASRADDPYVSTVSGAGSKMSIDTGWKATDLTRVELDCAVATNMAEEAAATVLWYLFDCNCSPRIQLGYAQSGLRYMAGGDTKFLDKSAFPMPTNAVDERRTFVVDNFAGVVAVVTGGVTNKTEA